MSASAVDRKVLGLFAIVVFTWGTSWYPITIHVRYVAPETALFWRFLFSSLLMFAVVRWQGVTLRFAPRHHLWFAGMGACLFCFNYLLMYYAAFELASGMLAVIFSTAAVWGMAIDAAVFRRPVGLRAVAGAAVGIGGLVLVFAPEIAAAEVSEATLGAVGLALAGTLVFSIGSSFSAAAQKRGLTIRGATAWALVYGTVLLLVVVLAGGNGFALPAAPDFVLAMTWHVVFTTAIAFAAYLALVGRIGVGGAAYTTVVFPLVALTLSAWLEGYQWTLAAAIGVVLVGAGNVLVLSGGRARPAAKAGAA